MFAACLLGSTPLPPSDVIDALLGQGAPGDEIVVWQIRLPRALAALAVGAGLGMGGAALQGLLRNPLAEPGILGVSATAALGATCTIYYGLAALSPWALPLGAVMGALVATGLIVLVALRTTSVVTLILVGVGLSSFAAAAMSLLMNFAPHPFTLADLVDWTLGSVANRGFPDLALALPFGLVGAVTLWFWRRSLAVLTLGEEAAHGAGVNLPALRAGVVLGAGLLAGAAVSLAGAIGFVGIVAAHVVRPWVQFDVARSLLPSALLGGLLLVVADVLLRLLPTQNELKLGVLAALLGAPVFVWIALRRQP